ncbi:hypothetical protein QE152_g19608 [Popillia japonica]|uniref:Uncharacterized protein n=1 Tax=Popillia japonica TaxID=7064 RepID=A0AAW1KSC0_POPJA
MRSVWKKVCPQIVPQVQHLEDQSFGELSGKILELARKLDVDLTQIDVEKLIASHSEPLSNDELVEFEAARAADEETHAEMEEEEKAFITKEMSLGFQELYSVLSSAEMEEEEKAFITKEMSLGFQELYSVLSRFEKLQTVQYVYDIQPHNSTIKVMVIS